MLISTRGIVIRNTKYSDNSVISKIYTRRLGMQSYIINNIHSPKAQIKPSLLLPATILEVVAYHNNLKDIHRIKEARPSPVFESLPFDVIKSSIGLFISELVNKSIKEEEANEPLYDFIEECILYLEHSAVSETLLPLFFILNLSRFLGFAPNDNWSATSPTFHMEDGGFTKNTGREEIIVVEPHSEYLNILLGTTLSGLGELKIPKFSRQLLLNKMVAYYSLHIPGFINLKSLPVLVNTLN
jgi:DNA repair protein RecO (recombination protein O)